MKINRMLCLLLAFVMIFTIAFPTAGLAGDFEEEFFLEEEYVDDSAYYEEELWDEYNDFEYEDEFFFEDENVESFEEWEEYTEPSEEMIQEDFSEDEEHLFEGDDAQFAEGFEVIEDTATFDAGELVITAPVDVTAPSGEPVSFQISVSGGTAPYTYQWQTKQVNKDWQNTRLTGYNTDTLSFAAAASYNNRQYRCIVTDANGVTGTSDPATLTIGTPVVVGELEITAPENVTVPSGEPVSFQISVSGGTAPYTYQWETKQVNKDWQTTKLTGYNTDTLSFTAAASYNNRQYRCVVTDANGVTGTSDPATLTIGTPVVVGELEITAPADVTVPSGEPVSFQISVSGGTAPYTYQWQTKQVNKDWQNTRLTGYNTDTLSFAAAASYNNRQYRCIVTDANGATGTSEAATLTIGTPAVVGDLEITAPASVTVSSGETASFQISVSGGTAPYSYQWQTKQVNKDWQNTKLGGYNTDTLSFPAAASYNNRQYRCVVTDSNGATGTSEAATLEISSDFVENDVVYAKLADGSGYYVKRYNGNAAAVVVLAEVEGLPVEEIGAEAFMGNTSIQSIDLPDSIKVIRERAFKNCTNLSEMR